MKLELIYGPSRVPTGELDLVNLVERTLGIARNANGAVEEEKFLKESIQEGKDD